MKNFIFNKKDAVLKNSFGYALLEILFYISLFAILSVVVINAMIVMSKSFRETTIQAEFLNGGEVMERMSREVRGSISISSISASDLVLNTTDSGGSSKTIQFVLSGSDLRFLENGVFTGNLNNPNINITALSFAQITTTEGSGVKISFGVQSDNDRQNRTEYFYNTVVLRGAYQ